MAEENRTWGYDRLVGELAKLDLTVSASTVARVLARHDLEPAPTRRKTRRWIDFLAAQRAHVAAMDFFSVEALTPRGLVRYLVCFVIHHESRRVHIAGVRHDPDGAWMEQVARELTHADDGFLAGKKLLVMDRDPLYTARVREILRSGGVRPLRLPARSPNLNAYAERFVRSVRTECLDHLIILGERHLRCVLADYFEHYHTERPHQGLGNVVPIAAGREPARPTARAGPITRRTRLGGLLSHYCRKAA
jgi:putative transposase